jgi:hypothetical protein
MMPFHFTLRRLATAGLLLLAASVQAQSLTLWPAVVPLKGDFGQSTTQTLTLRNDTDLALSFSMEARDVVVRDGARVFVEAGKLPDSVAASAVFTPSRVDIAPRSSASVKVLLTLPTAMNSRAVATTFRSVTPVQQGGRPTYLSLGSLFTFTMSERIALTPEALSIENPSKGTSLRLKARLLNSGEEPVVPSGMSVLLNEQGQIVGKTAFAPKRLLPGEKGELVAVYPGDLPSGSYRVVSTVDAAGHAYSLSGSVVVP